MPLYIYFFCADNDIVNFLYSIWDPDLIHCSAQLLLKQGNWALQ